MAKNKNLIKNTSYNFKLRSRPSFFIGIYIITTSLLIDMVIVGFTTEASPFSFLTVNFLEFFIFSISLLGITFSLLALFFGNRKHQRRIGYKIWNKNSKKMMWFVFLLLTILYIIAFYLLRTAQEAFIIPTFIISYGILLLILNLSKTITLYLFSIASILIGFIPLFVDGFGFYTLIILGVIHLIYSYLNKKLNALQIQ